MAGNAAVAGRSVVSRALAVLSTFEDGHREQTLSQIARRSGTSLSTTHRLLAELAAWGAVVRRSDGAYVVGRRIWELGLLAPAQADLRAAAAPFLSDVHAATRATVHLAVRDRDQALYLDSTSGHASVSVLSTLGSRLPLHATGVGKVLLAHAPHAVVRAVLDRLERVTPYTITQPGRLADQLDRVRERGYACTVEEMSLGACSVAVPITGADDRVCAALGLVVPQLGSDVSRLVPVLQQAAHGIGARLR